MLKKNKGATLIEIIVVLAINAIVLTILGSIYLSSSQYLSYFSNQRETNMEVEEMFSLFSKKLKFATTLKVENNPPSDTGYEIYCISQRLGKSKNNLEAGRLYKCEMDSQGKIKYQDIYGDMFYEHGNISVEVISCASNQGNPISDSLELKFYMLDKDETEDTTTNYIYDKDVVVNIYNMSGLPQSGKVFVNGSDALNQHLNNHTNDLYFWLKTEKGTTATSILADEMEIWRIMNCLYEEKETGFYTHLSGADQNSVNNHAYGFLGKEYTDYSNNTASWPVIDDAFISTYGLNNKQGVQNGMKLFPYHYVDNTSECDVLFYTLSTTSDTAFYTEFNTNLKTNLIFVQEENAYYYFGVNQVNSLGNKITSLSVVNTDGSLKNVTSIPVDAKTVIRYVDQDGKNYESTITSSQNIKNFFKKYGTKVAEISHE